jgi:hypothetical protein
MLLRRPFGRTARSFGRTARSWTRTVAALLAVVVLGGTADWGHAGGDDAACNPTVVQHDHAAHRFISQTQAPGAPANHCDLCHLLRLLHTALSVKPSTAALVSRVAARRPPDGVHTVALVTFGVPSRAPPAFAL